MLKGIILRKECVTNMEENKQIFRQKSLDRVSSPEQLDKYIKTTTPSVWLLMAAIIVFLCGVIVWATVGKIETSSETGCIVNNGKATCIISEADYERVSKDAYLELEENKLEISVAKNPLEANESTNAFILHAANIEKGDWYYEVSAKTSLANGEYSGKVVFEIISPITFVLN